jgi:hypothetical protein
MSIDIVLNVCNEVTIAIVQFFFMLRSRFEEKREPSCKYGKPISHWGDAMVCKKII